MTCAVFLSPFNLFTLMALYILCAVFCSPCWPFLFCVRYFVRPFYLTQLYLFALLALSISCTVFCSPFLLNTPYLFALLALSVSCTVFYSPFLHYICSPWCYFAKEYNFTFALSGLHMSTLFSGAAPVRSLARTATSIYHFLPVWNVPLDSTV